MTKGQWPTHGHVSAVASLTSPKSSRRQGSLTRRKIQWLGRLLRLVPRHFSSLRPVSLAQLRSLWGERGVATRRKKGNQVNHVRHSVQLSQDFPTPLKAATRLVHPRKQTFLLCAGEVSDGP